ncbi:DinB family protein [Telluribacter sp.]|jgi:uncharacterized damage-inducible protein DinB|uniref:DinB family protein n=1 Tax=Telluribacter sp. TaxID=1978767 RepID=UPI002E0EB963|nr:DinB family protein [Telluribacter sp.]
MKNKLLSKLLVLVLVTLSTASFAQSISQMSADWKRAKEYTQEYLDAMPADGLSYKPMPEVRSFAEQMLHLANGNFNFAAAASGKANPYQGKNLEKMPEYTTKEALSRIVGESYDFMISSLDGAKDGDMGASIKLFGRDMGRGVAYGKAFEHQTHHRGQTTTYIRMKGIKPPNEKLF